MQRIFICIGGSFGGDEGHALVARLASMYLAWAARSGLDASLRQSRCEAGDGLSWAVVAIERPVDPGALRAECGVHACVRIPPTDDLGRRHMSFAGVALTEDEPDGPFPARFAWGDEVRFYRLDPDPALLGPARRLLDADPLAVLAGDLEAAWRAL